MADNYIEKRMEELRLGKLQIKKAVPGIRPKARRVLVAGGCHGPAREKALEYRRQGCRVAVFDSDATAGRKMAHDHGVRFHRVEIENESAIKREMLSLLNAWRGIEIIVTNEKNRRLLDTLVDNWKEKLPIKDESPIEIVIL
ncbi:MAG: hypothetical protein K2N25_04665 [Muribaculaceae bacterium]|nr:hypothetical protein [Muribaculaceae bacterium]